MHIFINTAGAILYRLWLKSLKTIIKLGINVEYKNTFDLESQKKITILQKCKLMTDFKHPESAEAEL